MNIINLIRVKNRLTSVLMPEQTARAAVKLFLTPRRFNLKDWEVVAEQSCRRVAFGDHFSAACWGQGERKILLMHGWESRATQMISLVEPLVEKGFTVVAIDGPLHGHSQGDQANPVAFAMAIKAAAEELGPFESVVGHSIGGAAIAIAMEAGVKFERCALLAAPACVHDVLSAFAGYIGLTAATRARFIHKVETIVGRQSKDLDVGKIFAQLQPEVLIIHCQDDIEVPYTSLTAITKAYPAAQSHSVTGLGHRKVLRDPKICAKVATFMTEARLEG